jgi:hypothetical protein
VLVAKPCSVFRTSDVRKYSVGTAFRDYGLILQLVADNGTEDGPGVLKVDCEIKQTTLAAASAAQWAAAASAADPRAPAPGCGSGCGSGSGSGGGGGGGSGCGCGCGGGDGVDVD